MQIRQLRTNRPILITGDGEPPLVSLTPAGSLITACGQIVDVFFGTNQEVAVGGYYLKTGDRWYAINAEAIAEAVCDCDRMLNRSGVNGKHPPKNGESKT